MGIFNQQPHYKQSFTKGIRGAPGIGFNLTSDDNYDMLNKKLVNVGKGTSNSDAITKNQLDTAIGNKHGNDENIEVKDTYNVINSKKRTLNQLKANDDSLVSYDEVEDNFVKLNEASTMGANLNMNSNKVANIGTATSGGDALNKTYADTKLPESGGTMTGNLNMGNNKITGLPQTTQNGDAVDFEFFNKNMPLGGRDSYGNLFCSLKALYRVVTITNEPSSVTRVRWVNNRFISKASGTMTGNLNMGNNKITGLPLATQNGDAMDFEFFNKYTPLGGRDSYGNLFCSLKAL